MSYHCLYTAVLFLDSPELTEQRPTANCKTRAPLPRGSLRPDGWQGDDVRPPPEKKRSWINQSRNSRALQLIRAMDALAQLTLEPHHYAWVAICLASLLWYFFSGNRAPAGGGGGAAPAAPAASAEEQAAARRVAAERAQKRAGELAQMRSEIAEQDARKAETAAAAAAALEAARARKQAAFDAKQAAELTPQQRAERATARAGSQPAAPTPTPPKKAAATSVARSSSSSGGASEDKLKAARVASEDTHTAAALPKLPLLAQVQTLFDPSGGGLELPDGLVLGDLPLEEVMDELLLTLPLRRCR